MAQRPQPENPLDPEVPGTAAGQDRPLESGSGLTLPLNSSFIVHEGKQFQVIWDSTSLGTLKECPRKYYYTMHLGYVPKSRSFHLTFGIHLHEALESYDYARAEGDSHEDALRKAVHETLCRTGTRSDDGTWEPWVSDDSTGYKTREQLVRTVIWHLTQHEHDVLKTVILANGKPAVELSFRMELPALAPHGEPYLLSGHMDKLAEMPGNGIWVLDHKTTKNTIGDSFFEKFSPDNQMSLYSAAGRIVYNVPVAGVIVNGIQIAKGFIRSQRAPVSRTKAQLDEWLQHTAYFIRKAESYVNADFWPMNDKACFLCPFKSVCGKDAAVRDVFLKADFVQSRWNPAASRNTE